MEGNLTFFSFLILKKRKKFIIANQKQKGEVHS